MSTDILGKFSANDIITNITSDAVNLHSMTQCFLKEIPLQPTLVRVNTSASGAQANNTSAYPGISADGRFVAFASYASNLVPGDTNFVGRDMLGWDIFRKDTVTGAITRVSTSSSGGQANADSLAPAISGNGRLVAFQSGASNLVQGDTNGRADIFVKDVATQVTTRVSTSCSGAQANDNSFDPAISANGRFVAFASDASNLVPGDTNKVRDVFRKDLATGAITEVSTSRNGAEGDAASDAPAISADGRFVVFQSDAGNLVPGHASGQADIYRKDLATGAVARVDVSSNGTQANGPGFLPAISADGRFVAFASYAGNLVPGDTNGAEDVFVKDMVTGRITRASTSSSGAQGNRESAEVTISPDGRFVAFQSYATNFASGTTNGIGGVFVKDLVSNATIRLSASPDGAEGNNVSSSPAISGTGSVAFTSFASNFVPGDTNGTSDIFLARHFLTGLR